MEDIYLIYDTPYVVMVGSRVIAIMRYISYQREINSCSFTTLSTLGTSNLGLTPFGSLGVTGHSNYLVNIRNGPASYTMFICPVKSRRLCISQMKGT